MRGEPIVGVPDVDLSQGHLRIQMQELTVGRDLASPGRNRVQEGHGELRGCAKNARRECRYDRCNQ